MTPMPTTTRPQTSGRRMALAVLVLALAATAFGVWRERAIVQELNAEAQAKQQQGVNVK